MCACASAYAIMVHFQRFLSHCVLIFINVVCLLNFGDVVVVSDVVVVVVVADDVVIVGDVVVVV